MLAVEELSHSAVRINGGFFVMKREFLDMIEPRDELVEETFEQLIAERELIAYQYEGFFQAMDTIKDRQSLENLHESGQAPWRRFPTEDGLRPPCCLRTYVLTLSPAEPLRRVLAIGCHADDIEIGCGGTPLALIDANPELEVDWVVLVSPGDRAEEARASAASFLAGAADSRVEVHQFRDGFLPYVGGE